MTYIYIYIDITPHYRTILSLLLFFLPLQHSTGTTCIISGAVFLLPVFLFCFVFFVV